MKITGRWLISKALAYRCIDGTRHAISVSFGVNRAACPLKANDPTLSVHSRDSGAARTREAGDDGPLHPRCHRADLQDREPARWPERAAPQACQARHRGAVDAVALRPWLDQLWRSQTFSAITVRLGVTPTAGI